MDWFNFHERELETEMSIREVSMGRLPKYSTRASGVLWKGLKGQDEKVLTPAVEDLDIMLADAVSFMLEVAIKHYDVERMIKTTGKNKRTSIENLKGADLRENTDVRVKSGIDLFTNKEMKQDIVETFVEKGLITDPRAALELLESKSVEEYTEDEFIDERQAYRENDLMKEGKVYPVPDKNDNHEVHHKVHDNDRKKEDFGSWSDEAKEMLIRHTATHDLFMQPPPAPSPASAQAQGPTPAPVQSPGAQAALGVVPAPGGVAAPAPAAGAGAEPVLTPEEEQAFLAMLSGQAGV